MENRYLVLEMEDVKEALTEEELESLFNLVHKVTSYREKQGKLFNDYEVNIKE